MLTPMMNPILDAWVNTNPEDIITIGPKHWNPIHHGDILNAFNVEITGCQPHCEMVLDTLTNALVDENNLSDMQTWKDHRAKTN